MSMPKVRFTNRKKEKHHPAPNVVMRPRRPKTSACPVRKRRSLLTVKRLFGEAVDVECLRNKFREGKKKKIVKMPVFGNSFYLSRSRVTLSELTSQLFPTFWALQKLIQGWLILWLFLEHGHVPLHRPCRTPAEGQSTNSELLCYISTKRKLEWALICNCL